ncbi:hypothetical protein RRG08_026701 [Elysia crispata]|uniref:Uncharacterized protein n=1 Tax=Elysia crispata TaxID=231223 RepID=A0AAE0XVV7_9GAST|nr:hypothetical protein RRG08_026701 [Elysia crispata]
MEYGSWALAGSRLSRLSACLCFGQGSAERFDPKLILKNIVAATGPLSPLSDRHWSTLNTGPETKSSTIGPLEPGCGSPQIITLTPQDQCNVQVLYLTCLSHSQNEKATVALRAIQTTAIDNYSSSTMHSERGVRSKQVSHKLVRVVVQSTWRFCLPYLSVRGASGLNKCLISWFVSWFNLRGGSPYRTCHERGVRSKQVSHKLVRVCGSIYVEVLLTVPVSERGARSRQEPRLILGAALESQVKLLVCVTTGQEGHLWPCNIGRSSLEANVWSTHVGLPPTGSSWLSLEFQVERNGVS